MFVNCQESLICLLSTVGLPNYWIASNMLFNQGRGAEGRQLYCFRPKFLDPLRPPVWRRARASGRLCKLAREYDSYLDERGRGKAKKLVNITLYRLFDRITVCELSCCYNYNLLVETVLKFCVRDCIILLICFSGPVAGSPSIWRDQQGRQNLNLFFSL